MAAFCRYPAITRQPVGIPLPSPFPRSSQRRSQVVRQRRLEPHLLPAERMREREARAVQELALEPMASSVAVARVAGDRMADRREVRADLVGAPSLQPRFDEAVLPQ